MGFVHRTSQSEEDLIEIWLYIAQDSLVAADRVLDELEQRFTMLADNPKIGRYRPDIAPELRYFISGKYLILYKTVSDGVQIVRVIHGARDLLNVF